MAGDTIDEIRTYRRWSRDHTYRTSQQTETENGGVFEHMNLEKRRETKQRPAAHELPHYPGDLYDHLWDGTGSGAVLGASCAWHTSSRNGPDGPNRCRTL